MGIVNFGFNCGDKVRCKISGFAGVVVCQQQWFNGCKRYHVQPRGKKSTELLDSKVFDEDELEMVHAQHVPSPTVEKPQRKSTGGPAGSREASGPTSR